MKQIDLRDALNRIFSEEARTVICGGEMIIQGAVQYGFDEDSTVTAYESDGCVIIKDDSTYDGKRYLFRVVCPDGEHPRYLTAADRLLAEERDSITLCVTGALSPELDALYGWRKYSRMGEKFAENPFDCTVDGVKIRKLTAEDREVLLAFCRDEDAKPDDSPFAPKEYGNFEIYAEDLDGGRETVLGAWDGDVLTGAVTVIRHEVGGYCTLGQVGDLIVRKSHRRRGIGRALVRAALSAYPDLRYFYNFAKGNENSAATAESAGFTFAGAELWTR